MHPFVEALQCYVNPYRNKEKAEQMTRYMKDNFPFLGIQSPERKQLLRTFLQQYGKPQKEDLFEITRHLWSLPEREFQNIALDLFEKNLKHLDDTFLPLFEEMITTKSWWDTIDYIASRLIGFVFTSYPHHIEVYIPKWMASNNIWLQRTAILFQLKYKERTNTALLFSIIEELSDSKEFFIQKAIGWALREYAKTDAQTVLHFVNSHTLAPLSKREALKHIQTT
ncbi:DNA alkylation repair protein [Microbacteriaceae bacterium 4G12]